jgi:hypothetical protein
MSLKTFELKRKAAAAGGGEQILGSADTGSHACYMIYGVMKPGETGRQIRPGAGHEELILAVAGEFVVTGAYSGTLKEGTAFHLAGDETCFLENPGAAEAVYVLAGGHSTGGGHHA